MTSRLLRKTSLPRSTVTRSLVSPAVTYPSKVRIVEVGARDGLQNEATTVPAEIKVGLIERLFEAGITNIEAGSFVSPKWVPQMATTTTVLESLRSDVRRATHLSVLTPNRIGLEKAIANNVEEVAVFGAASETFSKRNINKSIADSMKVFEELITEAKEHHIRVRGYISCVLGCPYEGAVDPLKVADMSVALYEMGCYEVSLGDTIGIGNPLSTANLLSSIPSNIPIAVHFHDTYGMGIANLVIALQHGVTTIDSAVGGLGGCPYAVGATGNVATEDVIHLLHSMNVATDVDMSKLLLAADYINGFLKRNNTSRAALAYSSKCATDKK